ncbi:hypothetical protein GCM10022392_24610 [Mucilaginibacter panaciglaebae]|uniref:Uncharacterized protein n=1 Tax=Mucilaginibacter panaciglaebae TaxID=502331 RepID=A0ABP7WXS4_9SPHI
MLFRNSEVPTAETDLTGAGLSSEKNKLNGSALIIKAEAKLTNFINIDLKDSPKDTKVL